MSRSVDVSAVVVAPAADPQAIRACLSPAMVVEFDAEWDLALDEAKRDKELAPIHALLTTWRHVAYAELKDPGVHYRMLARAERSTRAGRATPG